MNRVEKAAEKLDADLKCGLVHIENDLVLFGPERAQINLCDSTRHTVFLQRHLWCQ